ncbi:MAG: CHAT domain-containing protein [Arcticibacter sp.]
MPAEFRLRFLFLVVFWFFGCGAYGGTNRAADLFLKAEKFYAQPDYDQAYVCFENALHVANTVNDYAILVATLNRMGRICLIRSSYDDAKKLARRSIKIMTNRKILSDPDYELLAEGYQLLGNIYAAIGDIEPAGDNYRLEYQIAEQLRNTKPAIKARALCDISAYYSFKMQIDSEYHYASEAYRMLPKIKSQPDVHAAVLMRYAYALKVRKRGHGKEYDQCYPLVRDLMKSALLVIDRTYHKPSIQKADALQALANTYADYVFSFPYTTPFNKIRDFEKALLLYKRALKEKEAIYGESGPSIATTCYTMALLNNSMQNRVSAIEWYEKGVSALTSSALNAFRFSDIHPIQTSDPYLLDIILTNLVKQLYADRNSEKILLKIHSINLARIALWQQLYIIHESRNLGSVIALWNHAPFEEAARSSYQLYLQTKQKEYLEDLYYFSESSRNNDFIKDHSQVFASNATQLRLTPLDSIIELAKKTKSLLINFLYPSSYGPFCYGIAISGDGINVHEFSQSHSDSLIAALKESMKRNQAVSYEGIAFELYQYVLDPLLVALKKDKAEDIIISPGPQFRGISFESLVATRTHSNDFRTFNYLIRSFNISYSLSSSLLYYQMKQTAEPSGRLTVFCPSVQGKSELLFSRQLFEKLQKRYKGYFEGDSLANKTTFLQHAANGGLLQVLSHAQSNSSNYEQSSIYLSGQEGNRITIEEIYKARIPSDLTILAACETGSGPNNYGEGTKSFDRAFTFSGSKAVISALWSVDEKSTMELLNNFYQNLEFTSKASSALRDAKLNYLKICASSSMANPFYWSGLSFSGNIAQPIVLEAKNNFLLWAVVLIIILAVTVRYFIKYR